MRRNDARRACKAQWRESVTWIGLVNVIIGGTSAEDCASLLNARHQSDGLADVVGARCQPGDMELNLNRFYDGGSFDGTEDPNPNHEMRVCLERRIEHRKDDRATAPLKELFTLERRLAYHHHAYDKPFIVPAQRNWRTDLTTVPWLFTWIVPRSGMHLPAALVHDALVDAVQPTEGTESTEPYIGPYLPREEADRVFRDAMADLGTGTVRRWLAWTGVALNTMNRGLPGTPTRGAYYQWAMRITLVITALVGILATLDLLDVGGPLLPWMIEGGLGTELLTGALGAVGFAIIVSLLWWRYWKAGAIATLALALLLHVTLVMLALSLLLAGLEWLTVHRRARALGLPVATSRRTRPA